MQQTGGNETVTLSLSERELGYLAAATSEFYHRMRDGQELMLVPDIADRVECARSLWYKIDQCAKLN